MQILYRWLDLIILLKVVHHYFGNFNQYFSVALELLLYSLSF